MTPKKPRPTFRSIATDILVMYRQVAGTAIEQAIKNQNLLGRRLQFLEDAANGRISLQTMTQDAAIKFQEILLDATAIQLPVKERKAQDSISLRVSLSSQSSGV